MSDDLDRLLEQAAGEVGGFPNTFSELRGLIQSLPSPLAPDIRSATTGQVNTVEPATAAQQVASSLAGGAPGSESGASLGVVSEIYYANANVLNNPLLAGMDSATPVNIGLAATAWAEQWEATYVLNSGVAPATIQIGLVDDRFQANGFHPLNSHAPYWEIGGGAAAFDVTLTIQPRNSWQMFFDTNLAYLVAAMKTTSFGAAIDANTTTLQTWVEVYDANGGGTILASSPVIDWLARGGDDNVYRQSAAASPGTAAAFQFKIRYRIRVAKNSAGGSESMTFGEPVLALASTQAPPPFSPIVARWLPSWLRVRQLGDTQPRMDVGIQSELQETASRIPSIRFGAGGASVMDTRLRRTAAAVLRLENPTGPAKAALEFVAGTTFGAAPAGTGRLWYDSATKHFFQTDDAGVDTDLAAGGGGGLTSGVPALTLGTANVAGVAATGIATDASIALFDATAPVTQAIGDAAAVGAAAFAARRDHKHGMPAFAAPAIVLGTAAAAGAAATLIRSDATIVAFDGTAAAGSTSRTGGTGAAAVAARRDHTHRGMQSIDDAIAGGFDWISRIKLAADTQYRFYLQLDGSDRANILMGAGGASAPDVSIVRDAADQVSFASGDILNMASGKLTLPVNTSAESTEGRVRQHTASSATTGARVTTYDSQRERDIANRGWQPFAYPVGSAITDALATNLAVAASGGAIAVPIPIAGHMLFQEIRFRVTAASGSGEFRLYVQRLNNGSAGENTLDEVPSSAGTWAAPGAAGNITGSVTSAPVYLGPGLYWLVMRTTSATALNIGTTAGGALAAATSQTKTLGVALAATLDFVAATWTKQTATIGVRLQGRVFGQTAAF